MSAAQPPAPPTDSIEATDYAINDKIYFLLYGGWRKGVVREQEGSSNESPRYLIRDEVTRQTCRIAGCDMRKRPSV